MTVPESHSEVHEQIGGHGNGRKIGADWFDQLFPDLAIPDGLTRDDLISAAHLVQQWSDGSEWTGVPVVVKVYRRLSEAAAARRWAVQAEPSRP